MASGQTAPQVPTAHSARREGMADPEAAARPQHLLQSLGPAEPTEFGAINPHTSPGPHHSQVPLLKEIRKNKLLWKGTSPNGG